MNFEDLKKWLEYEVRQCLLACRKKLSTGRVVFTPDCQNCYGALWTRDFEYMVEYAGEFLEPREIGQCIQLIINGISGDGVVPDRVDREGPVYVAGRKDAPLGRYNLDNAQFLVKLVYQYVRLTGDTDFFQEYKPALDRALDSIPVRDGLVYNDPRSPHSPYGFIDTVKATGHLLFSSILYWEALGNLEELSLRVGDHKSAHMYGRKRRIFEQGIDRLFDKETGAFLAASGSCRQVFIWGNAYAVYTGMAQGERRERIAEFLTANVDRYVKRGQIRHLMEDEAWEQLFVECPSAEYQNGAYWGTATGWISYVVSLKDRRRAKRIVKDAIEDYTRVTPCECINDGYIKLPGYVVTATNLWGALKRTAL